ncbi:GerAB/ArcD/ProY family transporter [Paenibacillus thalictri]|uniref:GerAB/ArcD/ProY family transporter n=1 Tax=Paenibacillus thalictri TaxID=2527873 RepID=UPI0013EF0210|nr:GerAB/ArcD/ProY family transporter [Paenibacillus thalictri]
MTIPLFFLGTHFSIIFLLYPRALLHTTQYGHWEPAVINMLIELVLLVILLHGLKKGGHQDFADLFLPLGRWISTPLLLPLILYILLIAIMVLRGFAELMIIVFVARSPLYAILALLCLITLLGSSIGSQGIMRASTLFSLLHIPALLFALFACINNSKLLNIFPVVNPTMDFLQHGKLLVSLFSICPFLLLGMLPPVCKIRIKPILMTMLPLSALYVYIVYIPILVYGVNAAVLMNFPLVTSIDSVNITWSIFNRVSLFYAVALLAFILIISSFSQWASAVLIHKMVPRWKESYIRPCLSLIIYTAALMIPNWDWYVDIYTVDTWFRMIIFVSIPVAVYIRGQFIQKQARKQVVQNDS